MDNFSTRCHVHQQFPYPGCQECYTAVDVNRIGHQKGTCIRETCWWHLNPDADTLQIIMTSWDRIEPRQVAMNRARG